MHSGGVEAGGLVDVVQPRGGFEQVGVRAENGREAVCPGGDTWTCAQQRGRDISGSTVISRAR
jgi:hypothetical protein